MALLGAKKLKTLQDKLTKKAEANKGSGDFASSEENFLQFKGSSKGTKYKVRVMPYDVKDEAGESTGLPFLEQYLHYGRDAADKFRKVRCPSSDNPDGKSIYEICPICKAGKAYYKPGRIDKEPVANARYGEYKRKFQTYMLAYVVSDPINPENNETFKSVFVTVGMRKFLYTQIFGIDPDAYGNDDDETETTEDEDAAGFDGIALEDGIDLIITVGLKQDGDRTYNDYSYTWARKASTLDINEKDITKAVADLKFQENAHYSSFEEVVKWNDDVVIPFGEDAASTITKVSAADVSDITSGLDDMDEDVTDEPVAEVKPKAKAKTKVTETVVEETAATDDFDPDDIDAYIDGI